MSITQLSVLNFKSQRIHNIIMYERTLTEKFGKKLKLERVKRDLSQEKLAELANLHKNAIGFIERAENSPTLDSIEKISKALNIAPSELLKFDEIMFTDGTKY